MTIDKATPQELVTSRLKAIFGIKKVSFDMPDPDAPEQGTLFVQVANYTPRVRDGIERGRMTGKIHIYSQNEQLPFGFFGKQIEKAARELKEAFFFHAFEENAGIYQNLTQRSASFVFKYSSQYNPTTDTIQSIEIRET